MPHVPDRLKDDLQPIVIGPPVPKVDRESALRKSEALIARLAELSEKAFEREARGRRALELLDAARVVAEHLQHREREVARLFDITERINLGVSLDETLDFVYREMHEVIPYNRIGFSLIDEETGDVVARWARSDREMKLGRGYRAPLEGSTLKDILDMGRARIINDLEGYLAGKPRSHSTRLIVEEGMRSSLTCPLIVQGKPVGFMFFSSVEKQAYSDAHVDFFRQIAGQLSAIVEKGRLFTGLEEQKKIVERQNETMRRDLDMAREVQRALIPEKAPDVPGLEIAFTYEPAIQVGGDVLDIICADDGRVVFFVGDAMGHGVPAALVMSVVKASLQPAVDLDAHPSRVLACLNHAVSNVLGFNLVTAACCLFDPSDRSAEIALAGHGAPVWYRAKEGRTESPGDGGLPLGVDKKGEFPSVRVTLPPGDALLFYTDGLIEATSPAEEQYGLERLIRCTDARIGGGVRPLLDAIRADLRDHTAGADLADDLTLLVLRAKA